MSESPLVLVLAFLQPPSGSPSFAFWLDWLSSSALRCAVFAFAPLQLRLWPPGLLFPLPRAGEGQAGKGPTIPMETETGRQKGGPHEHDSAGLCLSQVVEGPRGGGTGRQQ